MISRLLQLKCSSTITIKPGRVPFSSPYSNHRNESLHNSTDFPIKILNHRRTPENTSPVKSRQSLTNQHYHEHAHHIDPEHLSEQDPTHLQPYEWVH